VSLASGQGQSGSTLVRPDAGRTQPDQSRPGRLACLCPPLGALGRPGTAGAVALVAGAGFACLAQVLVYGTLPLAGAMLSRDTVEASLPMAVCLAGAVVASLPGNWLMDAFGRRAALATGASLGAAGGTTVAVGLLVLSLPVVLVGAFWLGIAQGFAMLYRHAAAAGDGDRRRQVAAVLGVGVAAGLVGPALATYAESLVAPLTLVGAVLAAALASVGALAAALAEPAAPAALPSPASPAPAIASTEPVPPAAATAAMGTEGGRASVLDGRFLVATAIGVVAWAAMASAMTHAPMALVDCGVTAAATYGIVAWHVVAMYAPAAAIGLFGLRVSPAAAATTGLGLLVGAFAATTLLDPVAGQTLRLLLVGAGWSLATLGATLMLHAGPPPRRLALALHDGALLSAALVAALLGGLF
jgi:MFS family permease